MSADPDSPLPPPAPASRTPEETPIETLPQKRRYRRPDPGESPAAPDSNPDNEIIVLSSLLQNLLARKQGADAESTESEARGKINRFVSRKDPPAAMGAPTPEPPRAPVPTAGEPVRAEAVAPSPTSTPSRQASGPEGMASIAFPKFEPRAFQPDPANTWWNRSGSTWGRGVLYFAFTAGLALAAFLAGRSDGRHTVSVTDRLALSTTGAVWTTAATEKLDQALAAEQAGDLDTARRTTDELLHDKELKSNVVVDAYSAMIDTRLGRVNDVEASLSRRLGPGAPSEVTAALGEAQAFNYCRRREFERAADSFAEVAKVRPLDPKNFLRWGEALRRAGRYAEAVARFEQALLRLPPAAPGAIDDREYVMFKRRLTQVEFGHAGELKEAIEQHLSVPAPTGYWLLTAAAVALQGRDLPAAVDLLKRAQAAFPPVQFTTLLEDYFFRTFADHPEMSGFLTPTSPEKLTERRLRMDFFVDP